MKPLILEECVAAMEGTCDCPVAQGSVTGVSTDTRTIRAGDLYFAIRGERFDGHDFVMSAFAGGAVAAVVRDDFGIAAGLRHGEAGPNGSMAGDGPRCTSGRNTAIGAPAPGILIRLPDPVEALGRLSRYYRREAIAGSATVIAVTGSNGKTTTKMMIAHLLAARWQGRASMKSYNNAIGVPLTLLSAEPGDSFLVCEVGMNAPREIDRLGRLIGPDIAVVTGVAEAHLEKFGSLSAIAEEKLSLLRHVQPEGCAVVNADVESVRWMLQRDRRFSGVKCITFGEWPGADLRLTACGTGILPVNGCGTGVSPMNECGTGILPVQSVEFTVNERFRYRLNVPGQHNALNALAAIGVARRFGMDHDEIAERLASFTLPAMRLQMERVGRLTLINDAYNANPASLAAAVGVLMDTPAEGRRVLIVGDMRELGEAAEGLHRRAAEHVARCGVQLVIAIGEHARTVSQTVRACAGEKVETHAYASTALARRRFLTHLKRSDTVLVKGSRALGLEVLVDAVREWASRTAPRSARLTRAAV